MGLKNKIFQVILRIICGIFLITAIFLGIIAVICSFSGGIPNIFGSNVYIVDTDAFGFLNKGTALFAKQVHYSEIQPKNVVIFKLENNKPAIGQVLKSELYDGVYSFDIITDNNIELTLTQSQVVAKGMSFSDFWGGVISFAVSPLGMMLVAVVPCVVIILIELTKFITKVMPQPEIETVKKQYEVPTYIPEKDRQNAAGKGRASAAYRKTAGLDDSIGLYDASVRRSSSVERIDVLEPAGTPQVPLFSPKKQPPPPPARKNTTMPLSQKKLDEAIAASKAERELIEMQRKREQAVNDIKRSRGAVIAAEKALEESGRMSSLTETATIRNKLSGTREIIDQNAIAKAAVQVGRTAVQQKPAPAPTEASAPPRQPAPDFKPEFKPQRILGRGAQGAPAGEQQNMGQNRQPSPQGPRLQNPQNAGQQTQVRRAPQLRQDDAVRQYAPRDSQMHTTTSIPRLDALLNDDSDSGRGYSIDDILAGLDRRT